ncbi:unnamed protein product, partial [Polarella glacialis]
FRLILSDKLISGGQRVQTFAFRPTSLGQIIGLLNDHFGFQDLCARHGSDAPQSVGAQLRMQGLDGPKRTPLHADSGLAAFFDGISFTQLPSIEVRLAVPRPISAPSAAVEAEEGASTRKRGRAARDQVEELEDANFKLMRATEQVSRRLDELERIVATQDERNSSVITKAKREMLAVQEKAMQEMQLKVDALKEDDANILRDLDVVRQHSSLVERDGIDGRKEIVDMMTAFGQKVDGQFDKVEAELDKLKAEDERLDAEANATKEDHRQQLEDHLNELQRLEDAKVNMDTWRKGEDGMSERITQELAAFNQRFESEQEHTATRLLQEAQAREKHDNEISKLLGETTIRLDEDIRKLLDEDIRKLNTDLQAGLQLADEQLQASRTELSTSIHDKVSSLDKKTDDRMSATDANIASKDAAIHSKLDDFSQNTIATFKSLDERLDEMVRVERARLGAIERDLSETSTKIRSECWAKIERVRTDYEQEAARLDADLGDLHMKHDVTKQEINFFQSRLKEQKDWTERQLTEQATATRAAAVDSQEGLAATTKMLHALRDDAVSFREKMAKYISLLQHSSDSQGDAINSLEMHRSRISAQLEALKGDHTAYTGDMDGWADDVRVKVERLFRALEPAKVEWRIARASQRAKELKRPLAVKSPSFQMKGIREGHMEFFPEGHNNSPDGKAVLRLFLPPTAHFRYQCWVGRNSEGPREHTPGSNLSVDLVIDSWKDQISDDGCIPIVVE